MATKKKNTKKVKPDSDMLDYISETFGMFGISEIQIGNKATIKTKKPKSVPKCVGAGDTFRVGDVVIDVTYNDNYPMRVTGIHNTRERGFGPYLQMCYIDAPECRNYSDTGMYAWSPSDRFRPDFRVLTQAEVDLWWAVNRPAKLANGWHEAPESFSRFLVKKGEVVVIERPHTSIQMDCVVADVGRVTGRAITVERAYSNPEKTVKAVKSSVRLPPPRI